MLPNALGRGIDSLTDIGCIQFNGPTESVEADSIRRGDLEP